MGLLAVNKNIFFLFRKLIFFILKIVADVMMIHLVTLVLMVEYVALIKPVFVRMDMLELLVQIVKF
jgi:hypothetical protein